MENKKNIPDELWGLYDEARKGRDFRLAFEILVQIQANEILSRAQEIRSIVKEETEKALGTN